MKRFSLLVALVCAPSAHAQSWTEFSQVFRTFPCPDGWSGCVVEDRAVQPDMIRDGAGIPQPAHARVGWFDMKPTPAFSAFVDLSEYRGPITARPEPEPLPTPRMDSDALTDAGAVVPRPTPRAVVAPAPTPTPTPQVEPVVDPAPAPAPHANAVDCPLEGLADLEIDASVGRLDPAVAAACQVGMGGLKLTEQDAISRLLMADAYARGDRASWSALVKHHLDEIDQSDPDLAYKYALYLSKTLPGTARQVLRWSDVAAQNKSKWEGDTHVTRVNGLHRLKATAAASLWASSEQVHLADPSDETAAKVGTYRNLAKVEAREWLEYASSAGKDPRPALQLCQSAAGTDDYCELD